MDLSFRVCSIPSVTIISSPPSLCSKKHFHSCVRISYKYRASQIGAILKMVVLDPKPKESESSVKRTTYLILLSLQYLESFCSRSMSANYDLKFKFVRVAIYCFILYMQVYTCICVPIGRLDINLGVLPQEVA